MKAPEGARCSRHPRAEAGELCARCGDFLCARCVASASGGEAYCAECAPHAEARFPWEERGEMGIARALAATALGTFTRAGEIYARRYRDRSIVPALAYAIAITAPVVWLNGAVELLWPSEERLRLAAGELGWLVGDAALIARALAAPLTIPLWVLLLASFFWIGLKASGPLGRPFSHVARTVAYVQGSTAPLSLVGLLPAPIDGWLSAAAVLIGLVLTGRALAALTRSSAWRMLGAALIAFAVLAVLACLAGTVAGLGAWAHAR